MSIEQANALLDYVLADPTRMVAAARWLAERVPPPGGPETKAQNFQAGFAGPQAQSQGGEAAQGQANLTALAGLMGRQGGTNFLPAPAGGWGGMLASGSPGTSGNSILPATGGLTTPSLLANGTAMPSGFFGF